jgi:hypothetical protein
MATKSATKIPLDSNSAGSITCEQCGLVLTVNAASCTNVAGALVLRCPCGFLFYASLNKRHYRRKDTALHGVYIKEGERKKTGKILVENLSPTGLRFRTIFQHAIAVHDTLLIKFALDDEHRTIISEYVRVKYVRGYQIGARFVEEESYNNDLGAYLLA